ncbi:hypothetical protein M1C57_14260 [Rhodococcus pyridinivorans]|uniref:hypothetical protein n=1 Tax=Rhodococcus pyridinivorans TaxID=103816 RepID=UPI00200AB168|nr:hypothetical protein [Rhodococcus pyridinivorans]UPW02867.1 hypothetical protein M1C57_14260 [Rhodococcus pyridinivorans]
MSDLELFLIVALFAENIALILANIVDRQATDRDGFGEEATHAMRRRHTDVVAVRNRDPDLRHWSQ